uniref:Uncharacterized protein n=1 Tax=Marseillevirus LCMAC102 TaxID=2506603 RepID=A0A481YTR6_9VIRU|nr:MAG: hypothetical protein LCMAC102_03670 [Marseillevirus LCMAC102]
MVRAYITYLIRTLGDLPSEKDFISICNQAPKLRLRYKYKNSIDFIYDKETDGIYPLDKNFSDKNLKLEIKAYSPKDFLKLMHKAIEFIVILNSSTIIHKNLFHMFQYIKSHNYTDYSQIITHLAKRGYLKISLSSNILATDERKFTLNENAGEKVKELKKYINTPYEVDCLGMKIWRTLSKEIEKLYLKVDN